jgi:predicted neutral ceramidase superfamily lipid hydrolase
MAWGCFGDGSRFLHVENTVLIGFLIELACACSLRLCLKIFVKKVEKPKMALGVFK